MRVCNVSESLVEGRTYMAFWRKAKSGVVMFLSSPLSVTRWLKTTIAAVATVLGFAEAREWVQKFRTCVAGSVSLKNSTPVLV